MLYIFKAYLFMLGAIDLLHSMWMVLGEEPPPLIRAVTTLAMVLVFFGVLMVAWEEFGQSMYDDVRDMWDAYRQPATPTTPVAIPPIRADDGGWVRPHGPLPTGQVVHV